MKVIALATTIFVALAAATAGSEKRQETQADPCPGLRYWKEQGPCWGAVGDEFYWKEEGPCWGYIGP
ncbi:hypothetical protein SLS56_006350 [Neofusicoccum ribis]|uniref:Uncharacterized protein n=1 Tax=Neofusicoccum ribis TaxID=45134 RepID=A0ABR3SRU7_9PEZI